MGILSPLKKMTLNCQNSVREVKQGLIGLGAPPAHTRGPLIRPNLGQWVAGSPPASKPGGAPGVCRPGLDVLRTDTPTIGQTSHPAGPALTELEKPPLGVPETLDPEDPLSKGHLRGDQGQEMPGRAYGREKEVDVGSARTSDAVCPLGTGLCT